MNPLITTLAVAVGVVLTFVATKLLDRLRRRDAETEAREVLARADRESVNRRKEAELEIKEMALQQKAESEREVIKMRQELHERIRTHSQEAARRVKEEGADNDLIDRLAGDPAFAAIRDKLPDLADPQRFVGLAPQQVERFIADEVEQIRRKYSGALGQKAQLEV